MIMRNVQIDNGPSGPPYSRERCTLLRHDSRVRALLFPATLTTVTLRERRTRLGPIFVDFRTFRAIRSAFRVLRVPPRARCSSTNRRLTRSAEVLARRGTFKRNGNQLIPPALACRGTSIRPCTWHSAQRR